MINNLRNSLIAASVLYLIVGVIMLFFPEAVNSVICSLVALLFLFFGVAGVVMYFKTELKTPYTSFTLVLGIILATFGIYIFLNPESFASFIPLMIGVFLIADSASKLSLSFDLKNLEYGNWWHMLISAFVVLAFGLILVFNPFEAVKATIMAIGTMLIVDAISNIYTIYTYSKIDTK